MKLLFLSIAPIICVAGSKSETSFLRRLDGIDVVQLNVIENANGVAETGQFFCDNLPPPYDGFDGSIFKDDTGCNGAGNTERYPASGSYDSFGGCWENLYFETKCQAEDKIEVTPHFSNNPTDCCNMHFKLKTGVAGTGLTAIDNDTVDVKSGTTYVLSIEGQGNGVSNVEVCYETCTVTTTTTTTAADTTTTTTAADTTTTTTAADTTTTTSAADTTTTTSSGAFDDPHFLTWNNTFFDFMGACDLKLITAPYFAPGLILDIDIRTTIRYEYSYIESSVIKIGNSTFEVSSYGSYLVDGISNADMPATLSGFTVEHFHQSKNVHIFEIQLGAGEKIVVKTFKDMVSVKFENADEKRFRGSQGMLGSYDKNGLMLARDGVTQLDDANAFAAEWQIKDDEPMLFQTRREPQYPRACRLPSAQVAETRRLGESTVSVEDAEIACASWPKEIASACVHDVLATGDLDLAAAGAF